MACFYRALSLAPYFQEPLHVFYFMPEGAFVDAEPLLDALADYPNLPTQPLISYAVEPLPWVREQLKGAGALGGLFFPLTADFLCALCPSMPPGRALDLTVRHDVAQLREVAYLILGHRDEDASLANLMAAAKQRRLEERNISLLTRRFLHQRGDPAAFGTAEEVNRAFESALMQ